MTEENRPDSSGRLSATSATTPSSVPNAPQYSSRRELRAATERQGQRHNAPRSARVEKSTVGNTPVNITPINETKVSNSAPEPLRPRITPPAAKPTRGERAMARRLNAAAPKPAAVVGSVPASLLKKKKRQHPAVVLFTLLIVPGFIASASIPAYAFTPAGSEHQAEVAATADEVSALSADEQEVSVSTNVAGAAVARDSITATTEAELAAQQAAAQAALIAAAALASYTASQTTSAGTTNGVVTAARAAGDDYPWPSASQVLSPLNYYYRQCVDFVAFRLNRDAGVSSAPWKYVWSNLTPGGGNASEWKRAWVSHGWTTSNVPVIGAVAWFNGNHVAYVKDIVGDNVIIEEYNGMAKRAYAIRTIPSSSVAKFLYPPPR